MSIKPKKLINLFIVCMFPVGAVNAQLEMSLMEGVRIFEPGYFSEFDPVTALDLVERTPGFDPQEQSGGRGLSGVRSNILINGDRPPPKGQSARQQLGGMPYASVERIELIDSGSGMDIDMQGYPQVVNVIIQEDASDYYEVTSRFNKTGDGDINQNNQDDYRLNANARLSRGGNEFRISGGGRDNVEQSPAGFVDIDPANPQQRVSSLNQSTRQEKFLQLGSDLKLGGESTLSVNAELFTEENSSQPVTLDSGSVSSAGVRQLFSNANDWREISAEYRRPIGERDEIMLAIVDSLSEDGSDSSLITADLNRSSLRERVSGETAARLLYTRKQTDSLTVRGVVTTAFNYFDGTFDVLENGTSLALDGTDSHVEEDRHTVGVEIDWSINGDWMFRSGLNAITYTINTHELSTGTQTDPQGFAALAWQPIERTTITLESRRDIGQLGFNQFLASNDLSSGILQAGAGTLEPERNWAHSLNFDRRFGDRGVMQLKLSSIKVDNPVRTVALSDSVTVSQNTSPELVNRIEASLQYPFEQFNMKDLVLELGASVSDSNTIDPISGEQRNVSWIPPYHWSLGLRRNPGDGNWSWGVNIWNRANNDNYSVRSIRKQSDFREWRAFLEWEFVNGVKLKGNYQGARYMSSESLFFPSVRQAGLDPSFIASTTNNRDPEASIALEWRRSKNLEVTASYTARPAFESEELLTPFGETAGTLQARNIASAPRMNLEFRLYR